MHEATQQPGAVVRGRVRGDGVELACADWLGRGAPLVGIHGLTASHLNFVGIAERLAGRRPLFAVDLRGRGDSEAKGPWGIAQHARDVAAAMRARRLGPSIVVGHSLGAYIAAALAAEHPELVEGLVLIDGGYLASPPPGVPLRPLLEAIYPSMVARLGHTYESRGAAREIWRRMPVFSDGDWGPWIEAFIDYDLAGESPRLHSKIHEPAVRFDFFDMAEKQLVDDRLRRVRAPLLLLRSQWGLTRAQPQLMSDDVVAGMRKLATVDVETIAATTHYTIALSEPGASRVAARLVRFAEELGQ
jgi:lipase